MTCHRFNMIEIALALGVIGIGVVSIFVLFPVGFGATRDAMAETYAANVADQFLHFVRYQVSQPDGALGDGVGWDDWITGAGARIPASWPGGSTQGGTGNTNLACPDAPPTGAGLTDSAGTLHDMRPTAVPGVYEIVAFVDGSNGCPDNDQLEATEIVDFRGVIALWQEDIPMLDSDSPPDPANPSNRNIGVALRCEISWPAAIDYTKRQKSAFYIELFNRQ